jgi:hypothetical protein
MLKAFWKRGWRGAVGLTAGYALVLQAFLVYGMATQAAAEGDSPYSGSFFVFCFSDDGAGTPDGAAAPIKLKTHCPICTLSPAATLPEPLGPPIAQAVRAERTAFVSAAACIAYHSARAGLSRAPPLPV